MTVGAIQTNGYPAAASAARTAPGAADTGAVFSALLHSAAPESAKSTDYDAVFQRAAKQYGVPVNLLKAVAKAESNYNPGAVSRCGALGVMQLMPSTAQGLGVTDPLDPEQNIMGGAKYLSDKLKKYDGSVELALAAYNAGSGNVAKYGGVPPFQETQNYIGKVLQYAGMAPGAVVPASGTADSAALTSLYALRLLGNADSFGGTQNTLAGLLGASGTAGLTSQNYLSLLQLIASQMQLGSTQPLAGDLTDSLSGSAGSML